MSRVACISTEAEERIKQALFLHGQGAAHKLISCRACDLRELISAVEQARLAPALAAEILTLQAEIEALRERADLARRVLTP